MPGAATATGPELHVRARHVFSEHYEVLRGSRVLTTVNIRWFREAGSFVLEEVSYAVGRRGLASGDFYVERHGEALATAEKPSAFSRRFVVRYAGEDYELAPYTPFRRGFVLRHGGEPVGSVEPTSFFTRSAKADLPEAFPLPVQVFVIWLVLVSWKRHRSSGGD